LHVESEYQVKEALTLDSTVPVPVISALAVLKYHVR